MYTNIYYFRHINTIGGIETFLYQLAKKYANNDLTIVYQTADINQLTRLQKYVRCVRYDAKSARKIKCKKAFFNFNLDIIDNVEAEEYCLVVHGDYRFLKGNPPNHHKINKIIGVSKMACLGYEELTGKKCELCYNPLMVTTPIRIVKLLSASRLHDENKGCERIKCLAQAMDRYASRNNLLYEWQIFSDIIAPISPNVIIRKPTLSVVDYMYDADYICQLSDNGEGYNYTVNEALSIGKPVIITPCDVYSELNIDDTMSIRLDYDMHNIDEVVEKIFNNADKYRFNYVPPKDRWDELLVESESTYNEEVESMVKIRAIKANGYTDTQLDRHVDNGEEYYVDEARAEVIINAGFAIRVEEPQIKEIEKEIKTATPKAVNKRNAKSR